MRNRNYPDVHNSSSAIHRMVQMRCGHVSKQNDCDCSSVQLFGQFFRTIFWQCCFCWSMYRIVGWKQTTLAGNELGLKIFWLETVFQNITSCQPLAAGNTIWLVGFLEDGRAKHQPETPFDWKHHLHGSSWKQITSSSAPYIWNKNPFVLHKMKPTDSLLTSAGEKCAPEKCAAIAAERATQCYHTK